MSDYQVPGIPFPPFPPPFVADQPSAYAPQPAMAGTFDLTPWTDIVPKVCDVALDPGLFVCRGASDSSVKALALSTDVTANLAGVLRFWELRAPNGPVGGPYSPNYNAEDMAPCVKSGRGWVKCEGTLTPGEPVYAVYSTADGLTIGSVTNTAGAGPSAAIVPNCVVIVGSGACSHVTPGAVKLQFLVQN
jgi:hypothetical protein